MPYFLISFRPEMFTLLFCLIFFHASHVMCDQNVGQEVEYLRIRSTIQSRFAVTTFSSKIRNLENKAREIFFHTVIPEEAFITNFSMLIKDDVIYGNVQEKEKAKETYLAAVERGQSAGLVAEKPRETNSFQISVNVGANESVIFNLTYQEVLKRVHGVYKHVINVETEKGVKEINTEVKINEMGTIKRVKVPKFEPKIGEKTNLELLGSGDEPKAKIDIVDLKGISEATVKFAGGGDTSANKTVGQLAVLYDVQRDETAGSVQVLDGHFVHFFAPSGLTKGKKHIFFVLDRSGSMSGKKFAQLKDAMKRIIGELDEQDKFNILFFDHKLYPWKLESVMATKEKKQEAIQHVMNTDISGATDIFLALKSALERIQIEYTDAFSPMILFLTDGEATSGLQDNNLIAQQVTELNRQNSSTAGPLCSIHGLAFGRGADYKLVQRLSANNRGLAKKIFEDADADLQLTGFYAEIASPLLSDVKFHYLNGTVDVNSLVQLGEYNYYDGGEMVVIGRLVNDTDQPTQVPATGAGATTEVPPPVINPLFDVQVTARAAAGAQRTFASRAVECCLRPWCPWPPRPLPDRPETAPERLEPSTSLQGFVERMWAYLTVKKLLKQYELEPKDNEAKKAEALRLSLKYKFVTSLTSMVVVQPDGNKTSGLQQSSESPSSSAAHDYRSAPIRGAPGISMLRSGDPGRSGSWGDDGLPSGPDMYAPTTDLLGGHRMTTSTVKPRLSLHEKPLVVYFEVSDDVPQTVIAKNLQFLKNIENSVQSKSRAIFMQISFLKVSENQSNFQPFDVLTPTKVETNEISALKRRHLSTLDNRPEKMTILDNGKKDGGHVTLVLLKGRRNVPSLNAALLPFLKNETKTATWVFVVCLDGCQFDLADMPPELSRLKFVTDSNSFDQIREKLFE